jgi:hypothetical protein
MIFFSSRSELVIICAQLLCYINSYFLNIVVFKSSQLWVILMFNFFYLRALSSLYYANQTHKDVNHLKYQKKDEKS